MCSKKVMEVKEQNPWWRKAINHRVLIITAIVFLFCLCFHWLYFCHPYIIDGVRLYYKMLHFIFLYVVIFYVNYLVTHFYDDKIKINVFCAGVFFAIMMLIILLTWPGMWSWDDINTVNLCQRYELNAWQHFFTGVFQILCLQTLPFVAGIPIIQSLFAALIVGYVTSNIAFSYGKTTRQRTCIIIGMLLLVLAPSNLLFLLSGYRMGMYVYIDLLLIGYLMILRKNIKFLSGWYIALIGVLTVLVASWRSEAFFYPFIVFFILLLFGKKSIKLWKNLLLLLVTFVLTISVGLLNTHFIGNRLYSLTGTIGQISNLVKVADETDAENLVKIGKVLDVEKIKAHPDKTSSDYFWGGDWGKGDARCVIDGYTESEYIECLMATARLAIKYPKAVLHYSWSEFWRANNCPMLEYFKFYPVGNNACEDEYIKQVWNDVGDKIKNPINNRVRFVIASSLFGVNSKHEPLGNFFYNLIVPFALLLICLLYKLVTKQWFDVMLITLIIIRIIICGVVALATFMYYSPAFLCSYFLVFVFGVEFVIKNFGKKSEKETIYDLNSSKWIK